MAGSDLKHNTELNDSGRSAAAGAEQDLIKRFQSGDVRAFNEIVTLFRERVYWVARRMIGSHDDADDIVQEVFVRAYEHLGTFRAEAGLYTWLYRITVNVSLNAIQKKKVREYLKLDDIIESIDSGGEETDEGLLKQEYETLLEKAIAGLPAKQKMVFVMKYYEEISFEEMAKALNKSVGGLKANYFHAVQKIQKYMRSALNS